MTIRVVLSSHFVKSAERTIERQRKLALTHFEKTGHSQHSGAGMLLPFIINHCEENKIPYVLKAYPGKGYYIEKAPPL